MSEGATQLVWSSRGAGAAMIDGGGKLLWGFDGVRLVSRTGRWWIRWSRSERVL